MSTPKSRLNELAHARGWPHPSYIVTGAYGPDHARTYQVQCNVNGQNFDGSGTSKKAAEHHAAALALECVSSGSSAPANSSALTVLSPHVFFVTVHFSGVGAEVKDALVRVDVPDARVMDELLGASFSIVFKDDKFVAVTTPVNAAGRPLVDEVLKVGPAIRNSFYIDTYPLIDVKVSSFKTAAQYRASLEAALASI